MEIRRITGVSGELRALEEINEEAIPECERNTLADLMASGAEVYCIDVEGEPAGFIVTRSWRNIMYLAYLAVRADLRSCGIGGRVIRELIRRYPDRQVIVEYEAPDERRADNTLPLRRKNFYLRNGLYETGWYTYYDGTEFEIGCSREDYDPQEFGDFTDWLSGIASDHIPHPYRKTEAGLRNEPDKEKDLQRMKGQAGGK